MKILHGVKKSKNEDMNKLMEGIDYVLVKSMDMISFSDLYGMCSNEEDRSKVREMMNVYQKMTDMVTISANIMIDQDAKITTLVEQNEKILKELQKKS